MSLTNFWDFVTASRIVTPISGGEQPQVEEPAPEAEAPPKTEQKLQPYRLPTPESRNVIPDSGQPLSERITTNALEILLGGSFVGATFIMEVVIPDKQSKGQEDSGEEEEPNPENEDNDDEV